MMSTVNVAETLTKCVEKDYPESDAIDFILNSNIAVIDFDLELAKLAAALRRKTDRRVLSLGDRACLALATRENAVAVTGDRIWATTRRRLQDRSDPLGKHMPAIHSQISPASDAFKANAEKMRGLVADFRDKAATVERGGSEEARERHRSRGKLLPRERLAQLLDFGSPFLEIGQFAAWDLYGGDIASAGMIAGIGRVEGSEAMIVVNDATVKGGTYYPLTVKKHLRAQEIALQNNLPCIYLVDSGGANLPNQDEVFPTASISAASSTTRPTCRPPAFRRSPASWARARRAAPMCRRCRTRPSWSGTRRRSSSAGRRW